jgi:hypothetical protein
MPSQTFYAMGLLHHILVVHVKLFAAFAFVIIERLSAERGTIRASATDLATIFIKAPCKENQLWRALTFSHLRSNNGEEIRTKLFICA